MATIVALLISLSISITLVSLAAPDTAHAISTELQQSIDGWHLRQGEDVRGVSDTEIANKPA
ncbi:hypothetical protein FKO01_06530 [Mesorhizobium sp. B2-3-3]|nr:hypothetical protein FKO01_06530 [Mesorhizobium sp. B2-3-3]